MGFYLVHCNVVHQFHCEISPLSKTEGEFHLSGIEVIRLNEYVEVLD